MKSLKYILGIVFLILLMGISWYAGKKFSFIQKKESESVTVVVEKMQKVLKLTTAEAHLSEIYDYKDYYSWDLPFFRKKALIKVNAVVSVGYDFEKMKFLTDEQNHIIRISNFPEPEILSIDHDLEYYDLTEGTFNQFSDKELSKLNANAKEFIEAKALQTEVVTISEEQKEELMVLLSAILEVSGWQLEIDKPKEFTLKD